MAVFRSRKPKSPPAPAIHSLLGKDVVLTGEIHTGARSLRIEGTVEGTIHSTGEVSIAPGGLVKGNVFAKHLVVTGRAEGIMKISDCLEIHGTGFVEGDVEVGSLVVDEGGTLQGVCVRRDQVRPAEAPVSAPAVVPATPVHALNGAAKGGILPLPKAGELKKLETKY
ncbi:polymer-forming cytoskeletal protein [Geothrix sp. 21YS21S-4]|uniref:bactofilin family protein n=1 Tax=Geothrix sp. 21YS21S-4 TaxID=3068889 RepID=UPI0027B8E9B9|nr:polymer-forming cytoskeletal protein [Geothrix sp. 21YS21S-4]